MIRAVRCQRAQAIWSRARNSASVTAQLTVCSSAARGHRGRQRSKGSLVTSGEIGRGGGFKPPATCYYHARGRRDGQTGKDRRGGGAFDRPGGGEDEAAAVAKGGRPQGGEAGAQRRRRRRHLPCQLPPTLSLFRLFACCTSSFALRNASGDRV